MPDPIDVTTTAHHIQNARTDLALALASISRTITADVRDDDLWEEFTRVEALLKHGDAIIRVAGEALDRAARR